MSPPTTGRLPGVEVVLLRRGAEVGAVAVDLRPDLGTIDVIARLRLRARAAGCTVRVRGAAPDLRDLLELVGLDDVLER